jgi:enoyl-CoA hydratase/carnithine racemase
MSGPEVLTVIDGPIARITFNRPLVRNALTAGMIERMHELLAEIEFDPPVRRLVMTGAGGHFMAGGDVGGFGRSLEPPPRRAAANSSSAPASPCRSSRRWSA